MKKILLLLVIGFLISCGGKKENELEISELDYKPEMDSLRFEGEIHFRNVKQLTFGGNNAEAYWSFDDKELIFQSDWDEINTQGCDQQFIMKTDGSAYETGEKYKLVSTGNGRTTCGYFLKDGSMIFASTHDDKHECPEVISLTGRYVWGIYPTYNIYKRDKDGTLEVLISGDSYDAEPTVSPDGKYMLFTSTRNGDLDLYRYEFETKEIIQITNELGYDGGAFFSRDSKKIVWRASRPKGEDADNYKELLSQNLVEPFELQVFVADIDGKNPKQITNLPKANWAPFFHPSGDKILFCSNHEDPKGRVFYIYSINLDGTNMYKVSNSGLFDAFPMFSYDGKKIVFASNRNIDRQPSRVTNIFVADWIEEPEDIDINFGK